MKQTYLAFDGDVSMGWCNANDRKNYTRVGEFNLDNVPDEVKDMVDPVIRTQVRYEFQMLVKETNYDIISAIRYLGV